MFMGKRVTGELRGMGGEDLQARLVELKGELAKERSLVSSGTRPENPGKIRKLRRGVARLLTVLNERGKNEVKS